MGSAAAVLVALALISGSAVLYRAKTRQESYSEALGALFATAGRAAGLSGARDQIDSNSDENSGDGDGGEAKRKLGTAGAGIPAIRLEATRRYKVCFAPEMFACMT